MQWKLYFNDLHGFKGDIGFISEPVPIEKSENGLTRRNLVALDSQEGVARIATIGHLFYDREDNPTGRHLIYFDNEYVPIGIGISHGIEISSPELVKSSVPNHVSIAFIGQLRQDTTYLATEHPALGDYINKSLDALMDLHK